MGCGLQETFHGDVEDIAFPEGLTLKKGRLSTAQAAELLHKSDLEVSDLVPGEYEGGFKLWEGAIDLCRFLLRLSHQQRATFQVNPPRFGVLDDPEQGSRVLELGCGHGLPGIVALHLGACVHFQDFNAEVLEALTMLNVSLALKEWNLPRDCVRFFSGAFQDVAALCRERGHCYDSVIASEILYNSESYPAILDILDRCLEEDGVAWIATKAYYFGVGGSATSFMKFVEGDGRFEAEVVWRNDEEEQGRRFILIVKRKV